MAPPSPGCPGRKKRRPTNRGRKTGGCQARPAALATAARCHPRRARLLWIRRAQTVTMQAVDPSRTPPERGRNRGMLQSRWTCAFLGIDRRSGGGGERGRSVAADCGACHGHARSGKLRDRDGPDRPRRRGGLHPRLFDRRAESGRPQSADGQIHVVLRTQHHQGLALQRKEPALFDGDRHGRHAQGWQGRGQLGSSVVYIAEFTSGQIFAYGLPWTMRAPKRSRSSRASSFRWMA